jgi:hypothetical protein
MVSKIPKPDSIADFGCWDSGALDAKIGGSQYR